MSLKNLSSEQKRAMLSQLLKKKASEKKKTFPLSFAQQRLWFLDQLEPGNAFYNVPAVLSMVGSVDREALEKSLNAIVERHEVLRSIITMVDDQPIQRIEDSVHVPLPLIDLGDQPYEQRKAAAIRQAHEEVLRPFDLSSGQLLRAKLLKLQEQEHVLLLTMHHIVSDGWSMDVFLRELTVLYQAFVQGEPSPLPELPVQYVDFAVWQRDDQRKEDQKKDLDYWRQQLADLPDLELPTDHVRPAVQSYRGATQRFTISREITEQLKALSQQEGVSMFMTLLTVFNILLYRYTGQKDIGIGSAIANRNRKELEDLIGFFVNTLVLRTKLEGDPAFRQLLQDVRETVLAAYAHPDLPFEKLVEEIQPERSLSRQPLFQVMFIFHNFPPPSLKLPDLTLDPINIETGTAKFDLQLAIIDVEDGLSCWLEYSTDLFEPAMIQQMQDHLVNLLTAVVRNPEQSINQLPLLSQTESEQLARATALPVQPADQPEDFFQQFIQHCTDQPSAPALVSSAGQLSAEQLLQHTNQVTHYLHGQGITAGMPVALAMPRSMDRVVAQLALLQLGATCLVLPPDAPEAYISRQLAAGNAQYILTYPGASTHFSTAAIPMLVIDLSNAQITARATTSWQEETHPGDCVALLPSAGSLVALERSTLNRQVHWLQQQFPLTATDTVLHTALPEAEHDLWTLCWSLAHGASVVIPTDAELHSPEQLQQILPVQHVSIVVGTPTILATLSTHSLLEPQVVRFLLSSGGILPPPVIQTCLEQFPSRLYSLYNLPATGTFFCARMDAAGGPEHMQGSATHAALYLLDEYQHMVPAGVYADLYVQSSGNGQEHLQRTGYRGRYRHQSGYTLLAQPERILQREGQAIALDEVQAALLAHPAIDDAIVLPRERRDQRYELCAYLVPTGPFIEKRIQDDLAQSLTANMLPDHLIPLMAFPLTKAGKIDHARLLNLDSTDPLVLTDWQERITALDIVERAAIVPQEYAEPLPVQHLSDLIHGWKATMHNEQLLSLDVSSAAEVKEDEDEHEVIAQAWSDGGPLIISEFAPKTLTEALFRTATFFKDKGITYIQPDGSILFQSYGVLLEEARCILTGLHKLGFKQGDTAILQSDNLRYHFSTFWACVLAGITPVTVAVAQTYAEKNSVVNKLYNIWELLDHPPIISNEHLVTPLKGLKQFWPMEGLEVLAVESLLKNEPSDDIYQCQPEDRVFFQLTSGSTGVPKCIQETHRGIIAHIHGSQQFNAYSSEDITLNWLPMDHVVPILTCHLKDIYLGISQIEVKTDIILMDPLRWLDLLEEYKVTLTWAPNFGFKLVSDWLTKNVQDRSWDLSSLRYCMNAGEQVTLPVVSDFLRLTAPFGLRPQVMQPSFGMAEACTCMTYQNDFTVETGTYRFEKSSLSRRLKFAQREDARAVNFIDLGPPVPGVEIRITNEHNQLVPEGVIGRFQIKGAVITPGITRILPLMRKLLSVMVGLIVATLVSF
ncbi:hypothetical protein KDW_43330 [Dictyobacter vulcani]|uniref:Carrier domain-containing protein n=1 Tax=Dictyobacter vulcani TaxID=2607529 RepID=A0A5J4KUI5_9CHLR|nr:condensation domain-containing protein [Dictyobacter vulcani]GER90171.1 hypothetical protein KDW_43330 [Dictyobacter vulcani]